MSDNDTDDVIDSGIGFVFDAFGDNFRDIDSRFELIDDSIGRVASKLEALDSGMVYTISAYEKRIETIGLHFEQRINQIESDFESRLKKNARLSYALISIFIFLIIFLIGGVMVSTG